MCSSGSGLSVPGPTTRSRDHARARRAERRARSAAELFDGVPLHEGARPSSASALTAPPSSGSRSEELEQDPSSMRSIAGSRVIATTPIPAAVSARSGIGL